MTDQPIWLLPASPESREQLENALSGLNRPIEVLEDDIALMAELEARKHSEDGGALLVIETEEDVASFYALINRLYVHPAGSQLPVLWLAPGLGDDLRPHNRELLLGIDIIFKPSHLAVIADAAAECLRRDEMRRSIRAKYIANEQWSKAEIEGLLGLDEQGLIIYANRPACRLLRVPAQQLIGLHWQSLLPTVIPKLLPTELTPLAEAQRIGAALEIRDCPLWRGDGTVVETQAAIVPMEQGPVAFLFAFVPPPVMEATGMVNDEGQIDQLTNLSNRATFMQALEGALRRKDITPILLVLDIDHLRHINDTLGYAMGDELLQITARRLREVLAGEGLLARIGGDRFAVLVERLADYREAGRVASKLKGIFRQPFLLKGSEIYGGASIGVAMAPTAGDTPEVLLKNAESALELAKQLGRNAIQFYSAKHNRHSLELMEREAALQHVLQLPVLPLDIQLWRNRNHDPVFASAVLAHEHARLLPDSPRVLAEESGLGVFYAQRLVRSALGDSHVLNRVPNGLPLVLQIPALAMRVDVALARLENLLKRHAWEPDQLVLHISHEDIDWEWLEGHLLTLRQWGVKLGLCVGRLGPSIESLCHLPWQQLVLGEALVQQVDESERVRIAISGLIELGQRLDLDVLAQGVNSKAQANFLYANGVDACMGSFIE